MNKKLMIGAGLGVAAAAAATCAAKGCQRDDTTSKWDRMRQKMEQMPEDFPPRMMFDNVAATRANTDEILRLMREGQTPESEPEHATN